jgi:hypothetical protein
MKYQNHPFERNYMKVTIELEPDQIDTLVKADLRSLLDCLESDLERVQEDQKGYVFVSDWQKDAKEIEGHIKAFEKVLRYYGEDLQECVDETAEREHDHIRGTTKMVELVDWEAVAADQAMTIAMLKLEKKEWVGLTDEEIKHEWEVWKCSLPRYIGFAKGIEAKLKEKNLG